jgi:hypothetical protein
MITLYRALRADRLLAFLTALLAAAVLFPLFRGRVLPFIDLPHHAALGGLLWDVVFRRNDAAAHYWVDFVPVPYWTIYLLLAVAERAFGVYAGTKIVVALALLAVPLGTMRLCLATGRSARLGLFSFLIAWDFNLYYGWLNHVLALGIALFLLARILEIESPRDALRTWPLGALLALTHVLPLVFLGVTAAVATLLKPRAIVARALAFVAPGIVLVPWLVRSLAGPRVDPGAVFDPIDVRLQSLFKFTLGNGPVALSAVRAEGVAFLVLLVGPLLLSLLPQRKSSTGIAAAAPILAAILLYFLLPMSVARPVTHWGTYPRFATPLLLGALLLPNPRLHGSRALALVPAVVACLWTSRAIAAQLADFDAEIAPFFQAARLVPAGARLLPLCLENAVRSSRSAMGESLHAYVTARVGGYNPYLFDAPTTMVHYRQSEKPPNPGGFGRNPKLFSMEAFADHYDYILVQGLAKDPVAGNPRSDTRTAVPIFEGGRYRLYRLE